MSYGKWVRWLSAAAAGLVVCTLTAVGIAGPASADPADTPSIDAGVMTSETGRTNSRLEVIVRFNRLTSATIFSRSSFEPASVLARRFSSEQLTTIAASGFRIS